MTGPRRRIDTDRPNLGDPPVHEDVQKELAFHVAMRAEELEAQGWSPAAARDEALRLFGNIDTVEEECAKMTRGKDRVERRSQRLDSLVQDLRYGLRNLRRSPIFTAVAILTLALGIGANTAIFSIVNGVLLRPLPYDRPDELVVVSEQKVNPDRTMWVAWQNAQDWREQASSFAALSVYRSAQLTVLGGDRPNRAHVAAVGEDFWKVLGVLPVLGRLTLAEDHRPDVEPVVVVREDYWRTELGGQPLDQLRLDISGIPAGVVGVVPADFEFPAGTEVWMPAQGDSDSRTAHNWNVVGRMNPGTTVERADTELDAITERLTAGHTDREFIADGASVEPLHESVAGSARRPLLLLLGAAGLVLLVACTNLASTLLARGAGRTREMAARVALGATRKRVARQLFTEALLLAALGGAAGQLVALVVLEGIKGMGPASVPRLEELGLDVWVLLFTGGTVVLTAVLFGFFPARKLASQDVSGMLRSGDRGSTGGGGFVWSALVAIEVSLTLVLLVGSGLLIRSFREVQSVDRGFDTEGIMTADLTLSPAKYRTLGDHALFYDRLLPLLEADPDVAAAGVTNAVPMTGFLSNGRLELDGDLSKHALAGYVVASGGYFGAMGIPLLRGRLFDGTDRMDGTHVAIVSRSFGERYWPGENPIGKQVSGGGMDNFWRERPFATVVGMVGDARYRDLTQEPLPVVYFPASQRPFRMRGSATLVVRATGSAASVPPILRAVLSDLDPDIPPRFSSMAQRIRDSVAERQFRMMVMGSFALIAGLLACLGIYGVVSYAVARRTREMGIRIALGASPAQVRHLMQGSAMGAVLLGAAIGLAAAGLLTRLMEGLLFEVSPTDPVTFAAVAAILVGAAWVASYLPARRSTAVDPAVTMRAE